MAGFIFGGDTGVTYDELQRRREVVEAMRERGAGRGAPRNVGEGLAAIGQALGGRIAETRLKRQEDEARTRASGQFDSIIGALGNRPQPTMTPFNPGPVSAPREPIAPAKAAESPDIAGTVPPDLGGVAPQRAAPVDIAGTVPPDLGGAPHQETSSFQQDPAAYLKQGLVARGMPEHVADGFVMNMQDESGLNPGINEAAPIVPGSRGGFGLSQWTGPRRRQLEAFAQERGMPVDDPDVQMDFLMHELGTTERGAAEAIMAAGTAGEAGAAIVNKFLRPAEEHRARREAQYLGGAQPSQGGTQVAQGGAPAMDMSQIQQLAELAKNPYLGEGQRAVVQQLLTQAMQQMDPQTQIQLQIAQAELAQLQNPTPKDTRTTAQRDFEYGQQNPEFLEWKSGQTPQTNIDVNTGQPVPEIGSIPQGFEVYIDPETGQRAMRPIPGGPAAAEAAEAEAQKTKQREVAGRAGTVVLDEIGRARDMATSSETATGLPGRVSQGIPTSDANRLQGYVQTITANIGFDRLQQMREASPTGGALGAVSERELSDLQAVLGSLDPSRGREDFLYNLGRLEKIYADIMAKAGAYPNAAEFGFGGQEGVGGAPSTAEGVGGAPGTAAGGYSEDELRWLEGN